MAQNNVPDSGEIVEILNLGESQLVNPVNTSEQISTNLLSPQRLDNDSAPNSIDPRIHQDLCKENTQPDDQMGRHGSCPCCEINGEAYDSIMCSNCKQWIHYRCTKLPAYVILALKHSRRQFNCIPCTEKLFSEHIDDSSFIAEAITRQETLHNFVKSPQISVRPKDKHTKPKDSNMKEAIIGAGSEKSQPDENANKASEVQINAPREQASDRRGRKDNPHRRGEKPLNSARSNKRNGESTLDPRIFCKDHLKKRCGVDSCQLIHKKLCYAFLEDGHGPNGCNSPEECGYEHPNICDGSWRRRKCMIDDCPYRHLARTIRPNSRRTQTPRYEQRPPLPHATERGNPPEFRNRQIEAQSKFTYPTYKQRSTQQRNANQDRIQVQHELHPSSNSNFEAHQTTYHRDYPNYDARNYVRTQYVRQPSTILPSEGNLTKQSYAQATEGMNSNENYKHQPSSERHFLGDHRLVDLINFKKETQLELATIRKMLSTIEDFVKPTQTYRLPNLSRRDY